MGPKQAKQLQQVFKMKRMLKSKSRQLGLSYECLMRVNDFTPAFVQNEDGKIVSYPAGFDITIENHSTSHWTLRSADMRWIREGRLLGGKGISTAQVYRIMANELRAHADEIFKRNVESITYEDVLALRASKGSDQ